MYRNVFGHPSAGRSDISHLGPRHIAQTVYDKSNVAAHQSFSLSDGSLGRFLWSVNYPVVPEDWKGAALWGWNKQLGITDGGEGKSVNDLNEGDARIARIVSGSGSPYDFVFYPLDVKPANPEGIIPKAWQAKTKGLYIFRNGWKGYEDIVAQFFLKSEGEGGWQNPDGGAVNLYGLGHAWTGRGAGVGKTRLRDAHTVVCLPDDEINKDMRAIMKDYQASEDGSGSVLADMDLIYQSQKTYKTPKGKVKKKPLVDRRFKLLKTTSSRPGSLANAVLQPTIPVKPVSLACSS